MLESRIKSLPTVFQYLFGDMPMPQVVHDRDGDRQSRATDDYATVSDVRHMKTAHMELRLTVTVLVSVITSMGMGRAGGMDTTETVDRKYQAASFMRDFMNGFLEDCAKMDPSDEKLKFSLLTIGEECFAVQDQVISQFSSSRRLPHIRGWQAFCDWWEAAYRDEFELPCKVLFNSATLNEPSKDETLSI